MAKCVAHSLDLLLEDIGKLHYFSEVIEGQKRVVRFITNHHYSLALFRQFAQKQLLKTGACPHGSSDCPLECKLCVFESAKFVRG